MINVNNFFCEYRTFNNQLPTELLLLQLHNVCLGYLTFHSCFSQLLLKKAVKNPLGKKIFQHYFLVAFVKQIQITQIHINMT